MGDDKEVTVGVALENLTGYADETNAYLAKILEVLQSMNERRRSMNEQLLEVTMNLPGE
jgi:hypothetical protein